MIIRNKFNGYGFDGTRLCHDPVSLSIAATQAGAASAAAAGTAAATTAATTAAAKAAALEAAKTAALEGGKTAALEASKKGIIDASMKQAATEATKQAATETAKQGIAQAGTQATQQSAVEAAKQGIFSNPAGMPPTAGTPLPPAGGTPLPPAGSAPLPPAGGAPNTMSANVSNNGIMTDAGLQGPGVEILPPKPGMTDAQAKALSEELANPTINQNFQGIKATPDKAFGPDSSGIYKGVDPATNMPYETFSSPTFKPPTGDGTGLQVPSKIAETFGQPKPPNALQKGFETGLQYAKDNPMTTGLGLMSAGQYLNQPKSEEEDKDKYKSSVDMSEFKPSIPKQPSFTRSYEYQTYQSGGPVEDMSRMNSIGANTGYPMAQLQTPAYSVSSASPMPVNTLSPTADASVNAYTGAAQFAGGGLSAAQRKEYGLSTRSQRAARNLTSSYEEMEAERQKEAMRLMGERSDPGIVPRSRTQMMSSPFSAAQAEHARLGKKSKVPVVAMPKTNLGDIDNYMDIPIEAAQGGIMHGLGGYSDGGRLLRGPGDGVSDSIPAVIGKRQPARLADGEFVIPARIVSELGNGSTEAGARKLYAMMERVQANRKKSIGKKKVAVNSKSDKHLPA